MNTNPCTLCPRQCKVDRETHFGVCRMRSNVRVARIALHMWEEPPISGTRGSGTVFFSGCTLRCIYCQNRVISHDGGGKEISTEVLASRMLELQDAGAHNLNFVTGTHFVPAILSSLRAIKNELHIPVVWNSSGYETLETVDALSEFVNIWLPDFKYASGDLSARLSGARDYPTVAEKAIKRMYEHAGAFRTDENGICTSGVIVRHLVLPGQRKDSCMVLDRLASSLPPDEIRLSLLWQYTPDFLPEGAEYDQLRRRVTSFEYESVRSHALDLGFSGFMQDRSSATRAYTPDFDV